MKKEQIHPEITCPYCRIGFGAIKITKEDTISQHIDIFWSRDAGLSRICKNVDLLKENLIESDGCQNPKFNEEFTIKLKELRQKFETNPDDISKENFEFCDYRISFVECMNWGDIDDEDENYDRDSI